MAQHSNVISAVPTTIITGFLGVGKTSAILHLLKTKPARERWAVLVNEFGEIGIDGSLFEGQHNETQGVYIREVPGGCMCCTTGLPMQIGLNQLLRKAKPSRLLIEPTGLGHPKEVLDVLISKNYNEILDVQKIVALVDARKLTDERYTRNETFNQQIAIADIVVGNKTDLYDAEDRHQLMDYVAQYGSPQTEVLFTQHGEIPVDALAGKTTATIECSNNYSDNHTHEIAESRPTLSEEPIPDCGYIKASNEGEGFKSVGWRISPSLTFNKQKLFAFLSGVSAERMKAVFITDNGVFGYNMTSDTLTELPLDECMESQIEIITDDIVEDWEPQLLACILAER